MAALIETLNSLRAEYEAKSAEAETLAARQDATGEDLVKAEKLFDECEKNILPRIDEVKSQLDRLGKLGERAASIKSHAGRLDSLPASNPFRNASTEYGGSVTVDVESKSVLDESGPGIFGEKAWDAIKSGEYRIGFARYVRKGRAAIDEFKTLQLGLDEQGGVFAPAELMNRVIGRLPAPTRLAGRVTTVNTGRDRVVMPTVRYSADNIYTTGFRVTKTGENPASATSHRVNDAGLFGTTEIPVHTFMLSGDLSLDMLEDTGFPLMSWMTDKFSETRDLLLESTLVNGTGVGEGLGFIPSADTANGIASVAGGHASNLTADGLIDLAYTLPEQYEENTVFVFNKTNTERALAKLKDSSNRYLYLPVDSSNEGIASARPRRLLGYDAIRSAFMPNVEANAFPVLFGDLRGIYLAQRAALSIQVIREPYVEQNRVAVVGRLRFGCRPVEPWKLRLLKISAS